MKRTVLFLICSALVASSARAQFLCNDLDTIATCAPRLKGEILGETKAAAVKAQDDVKKKTETGLQGLTTGLASSVKDFVPLLQLTGVLGAITTNQDTGVMTVALNTPFIATNGVTRDRAFQVKALIDTKPKIFDPIHTALPAAGRDAAEKDLLAVQNRQHVTLQLSTNVTTTRLGRNFEQYRDVADAIFEGVVKTLDRLVGDEFVTDTALDRLGRDGNGAIDVLFNTTRMIDIPARADLDSVQRRARIERALYESVKAAIAVETAFTKAVKGSGLNLFGQLVNNQPQLSFAVSRVYRDPLFGPEQLTAGLVFEVGFGNNINAFMDSGGQKACEDPSTPACRTALQKFTARADTKAAIKAGSRLAFHADVISNRSYAYDLPTQNIHLSYPQSWKFTAGATFGRLVGVDDDGNASARLDGSFDGEWSSDQRLAANRVVAAITLTKKFGDLSVPLGLRYASRSEFLSDFDHGISANVGLKFNLFPGLK